MCLGGSVENNKKKENWETDKVETFHEAQCAPVPAF